MARGESCRRAECRSVTEAMVGVRRLFAGVNTITISVHCRGQTTSVWNRGGDTVAHTRTTSLKHNNGNHIFDFELLFITRVFLIKQPFENISAFCIIDILFDIYDYSIFEYETYYSY